MPLFIELLKIVKYLLKKWEVFRQLQAGKYLSTTHVFSCYIVKSKLLKKIIEISKLIYQAFIKDQAILYILILKACI